MNETKVVVAFLQLIFTFVFVMAMYNIRLVAHQENQIIEEDLACCSLSLSMSFGAHLADILLLTAASTSTI